MKQAMIAFRPVATPFVKLFVEANMASPHFPGKVLEPMCGKPVLLWQIERLRQGKQGQHIVVVTSDSESDDLIAEFCKKNRIAVFRGDSVDVLHRFYQAAQYYPAQHYVRVHAGCPLMDPKLLENMLVAHQAQEYDYLSNVYPNRTCAKGFDVEIFKASALDRAHKEAKIIEERQHVTPYLYQNSSQFNVGTYYVLKGGENLHLMVSDPISFVLVEVVLEAMRKTKIHFALSDVLTMLENNPVWLKYAERCEFQSAAVRP